MSDGKKTFIERLEESNKRSEILSASIRELLLYVGFASAIISAIAYIVITAVMVNGFTSNFEVRNQIVFSILGAIVGLMITFSLRSQGIAFAKRNPDAQKVMRDYYEALNKTKKEKDLHTISHYMIKATIIDIIVKGTLVATSTFFILYIFIEGGKNWGLIGLALANIFLFTGFGLVGLANIYDKYLDEHIPVIKELTRKILGTNQEVLEIKQIEKEPI